MPLISQIGQSVANQLGNISLGTFNQSPNELVSNPVVVTFGGGPQLLLTVAGPITISSAPTSNASVGLCFLATASGGLPANAQVTVYLDGTPAAGGGPVSLLAGETKGYFIKDVGVFPFPTGVFANMTMEGETADNEVTFDFYACAIIDLVVTAF